MHTYDSSSSSAESTDSSVFDRPPPQLPSNETTDKVLFSFEDAKSNADESRHLIERIGSDYCDSGISPGIFEHQDTERRALVKSGRSVSFKDA